MMANSSMPRAQKKAKNGNGREIIPLNVALSTERSTWNIKSNCRPTKCRSDSDAASEGTA